MSQKLEIESNLNIYNFSNETDKSNKGKLGNYSVQSSFSNNETKKIPAYNPFDALKIQVDPNLSPKEYSISSISNNDNSECTVSAYNPFDALKIQIPQEYANSSIQIPTPLPTKNKENQMEMSSDEEGVVEYSDEEEEEGIVESYPPIPLEIPYNKEASETLFEMAMQKNKFLKKEDLEKLKKEGASFTRHGKYGNIPLIWSVANGHFDGASKIIEVGPIEQIFTHDNRETGNTPLHLVLAKAYKTQTATGQKIKTPYHALAYQLIIKAGNIIERKRLVNLQDKNGNTPLHIAYVRGDEMMIPLLCVHGALKSIRNFDGKFPSDMARMNYEERTNFLTKQTGGRNVFRPIDKEEQPF